MTSTTTKSDAIQHDAETAVYLFDDWFDLIEAGLRDRVRDFIETMIRTELMQLLAARAMQGSPTRVKGAMAPIAASPDIGTAAGPGR